VGKEPPSLAVSSNARASTHAFVTAAQGQLGRRFSILFAPRRFFKLGSFALQRFAYLSKLVSCLWAVKGVRKTSRLSRPRSDHLS
jgi:hypothetical protein